MTYFSELSLIIFCLILSSVESKDFCEAFKENNYKIDYGFELRQSEVKINSLLFIGHYYWKIDIKFDSVLGLKVELVSNNTIKSEWFGKNYKLGFSYKSPGMASYMTGLLKTNLKEIVWYEFNANNEELVKTNRTIDNMKIDFGSDFDPVIAYESIGSLFFDIVGKYPNNSIVSQIFYLQDLKQAIHLKNEPWSYIHEFLHKDLFQHMIAIYSKDQIFVFALDYAIKYIHINRFSKPEKPFDKKDLKTIIDCSNTSPTPTAESNILIPLLIIVFVLLCFLLLPILYLYFPKVCKPKETQTSIVSTERKNASEAPIPGPTPGRGSLSAEQSTESESTVTKNRSEKTERRVKFDPKVDSKTTDERRERTDPKKRSEIDSKRKLRFDTQNRSERTDRHT